ncbi:hypothetical protein [Bradyrhizobium sp. Ai1a-2]|uniref:hypothetical protein n=1 Tax=Bradyrhizobium sp. Ai1a-2 TaxID=196490 RepID=UPI001268FDC1|nr:hypothetical protein [Bradyrhizobium sp. Ai1a-2]
MCDGNAIGVFLLLAELAVITASIMLLTAIQNAESLLTAFKSVGGTVTTIVFVGLALANLVAAAGLVSSGCTGGGCGSSGSALLTAINITIGMLTGLTVSLAVATFVPPAVLIAGPAALITLAGAGGSFAYLGVLAATLAACLAPAATTPPAWLVLSAAVAFVTAFTAIFTAVYGAYYLSKDIAKINSAASG